MRGRKLDRQRLQHLAGISATASEEETTLQENHHDRPTASGKTRAVAAGIAEEIIEHAQQLSKTRSSRYQGAKEGSHIEDILELVKEELRQQGYTF